MGRNSGHHDRGSNKINNVCMKQLIPAMILGFIIGTCIVQCSHRPIGFTKVKCGAGIICTVGPDSTLIIMLDPGYHPVDIDTSWHLHFDSGVRIIYNGVVTGGSHCPKEKIIQKLIIHDWFLDKN